MEKFKKKYRIPSARLEEYDYGSNGIYFITICTQNREHYFGEIIDNKMQLSDIGEIIQKYWNAIPSQFPFILLNEFIIMPNHVHGILMIYKNDNNYCRDAINRVSTETNKTITGGITKTHNPMLHQNISTIIRWFKGRTAFEIRKQFFGFAWQPRFHDRIIRNEKEFCTIQEYIIQNPLNWKNDMNNI